MALVFATVLTYSERERPTSGASHQHGWEEQKHPGCEHLLWILMGPAPGMPLSQPPETRQKTHASYMFDYQERTQTPKPCRTLVNLHTNSTRGVRVTVVWLGICVTGRHDKILSCGFCFCVLLRSEYSFQCVSELSSSLQHWVEGKMWRPMNCSLIISEWRSWGWMLGFRLICYMLLSCMQSPPAWPPQKLPSTSPLLDWFKDVN